MPGLPPLRAADTSIDAKSLQPGFGAVSPE
jgi:hypothetical protein